MRASQLLTLPVSVAALLFTQSASCTQSSLPPEYAERLHLKPLSDRALYAGFNFTATTLATDYDNQNFRLFPRSLGQILQFAHTSELHLRFALGRWDEELWGDRPRNGAREGGTGVELWAWLDADTPSQAEERWSGLVNSLSGLFCASLNFIEQSKTIQPLLTFEPEGHLNTSSSRLHLMHGMLPHEVVCTENLTPFLKLLPCKGKAGVASLLDGHKVFDANWQTMAVDVRQVCTSASGCFWEVEQTVDMVLDLERSMRPRDNPIPRPPPIEDIVCDTTKHYHGEDTCYPVAGGSSKGWSLAQIFGRPIKGSCPLGERSTAADVVVEASPDHQVEVSSQTSTGGSSTLNALSRSYQLEEDQDFDFWVSKLGDTDERRIQSQLRASRQMTGYGQERGGMHIVITNPLPQAQRVVYLESIPWFLRPYIHTLKVDGAKVDKMFYTPAADRRRGTHLELLLEIPAESAVEMSYDFEKAILRYTEYPPDANRGFDIAPAIIRVLPSDAADGKQGSYLRTTSLLLPLPTPDFSMPYNVIILTSTVLALGFGSIFNLLIRRFVLLEEVPASPLAGIIARTANRLRGAKPSPKPVDKGEGSDSTVRTSGSIVASATSQGDDHSSVTMRRGIGIKRESQSSLVDQ